MVGSVSAGMGIEFGLVFGYDLYGNPNVGVYSEEFYTIGVDYSVGIVVKVVESNDGSDLTIYNFDGPGEDFNVGAGIPWYPVGIDATWGGDSYNGWDTGLNPWNWSDSNPSHNFKGGGVSFGSPVGVYRSWGQTYVKPWRWLNSKF